MISVGLAAHSNELSLDVHFQVDTGEQVIIILLFVVVFFCCFFRAEQHGEQMLSLLSRTLTSSYHDTLQVAMALESVVSLCLHEVVDVVTVWGVLGKGGRLTSDLRYGFRDM